MGDRPILLGHTPALRELNVRTFRPILIRNGTVGLRPLMYATCGTSFSNSRVTMRMPLSMRTRTRTEFLVLSMGGVLTPGSNAPVAAPSRSVILKYCCLAVRTRNKRGKAKAMFGSFGRVLLTCRGRAIRLRSLMGVEMMLRSKEDSVIRDAMNEFVFGRGVPRSLKFMSEDMSPFKLRVSFLISGGTLNGVVSGYFEGRKGARATMLLSRVGSLKFGCSAENNVAITITSVGVPRTGGNCVATTRRGISGCRGTCEENLVSSRRECREIVRA